jgi:hypothetical protein
MEHLTLADFEQWVNSPMTCMVRDYLLKERASMNSLDDSRLLEGNAYGQDLTALEALGLESAMRLSVVKGIDLITNFDDLQSALFPVAGEADD